MNFSVKRSPVIKLGAAKKEAGRVYALVAIHLPTDGRHLILSRYTQPEKDLQLLLDQLKLTLPEQPPPRISSTQTLMT